MLQTVIYIICLFVADIVLIATISWITILVMESTTLHSMLNKWYGWCDMCSISLCKIKNIICSNISNKNKEIKALIDDIKRNPIWDSCKRHIVSWLYLLTWIAVFCAIFALVISLHWKYPTETNSVIQEYTFGMYIWHFLTNNSLLVSLIAGFIGTFLVVLALRPRLTISNDLVQANNGLLRVAIYNKFLFTRLTDIQVEMAFVRWDKRLKGIRTCSIPMNKSNISIIYGLSKGSSSSCYIVHTESGFVWNEKYDEIRCRITATNNISGIKRVFEKYYAKDRIVRGVIKGRQVIGIDYYYPLDDKKLWDDDIKIRCEKVWEISDGIRKAILPIKIEDYDENIIQNSIDNVQLLDDEAVRALFPCIENNKDTINTLSTSLKELGDFYFQKANLNPENKETRSNLFKKINKNITFLADQMDRDIEDLYQSKLKENNLNTDSNGQ